MIEKWVKHFDLDYEEIIEIGRHELTKSNSSELNEAEIRRIIREEQQAAQLPINITTERHRQLVDQFQQKDLALEINAELLGLEEIDRDRLRSVLDFIKYQKKIAAEEAAKKRAAANENR